MDGSVLMDREEKLKDWPNKKDSDIASEIFNLYGFTPETEDTDVIHDEAVSTIIQRETDIQFFKRLALRNGFECFVEGPRVTSGRRNRRDAAAGSGRPFWGRNQCNRFSMEVNALDASECGHVPSDRINKEVLDAVAESSQQTALGATDATGLPGTGHAAGPRLSSAERHHRQRRK